MLDSQYAIAGGDGSFTVFLTNFVVSVCACASWLTLMVYFPAIALPVVVALKADELLVVEVAANKSALFSAVLAVWKLSSALFSVP